MSAVRTIAILMAVVSLIPRSAAQPEEGARLLEWARSRFEAVGLTYPTVRVVFHGGLADCEQRVGKYDASTSTVHLCRLQKRDVLHEFSHAWADQEMTDDERLRFQRFRGLETWGSPDVEWSERATEHAAEVLTWALMDENLLVRWVSDEPGTDRLLTIPGSSHEELVEAFAVLTGLTPDERLHDRPRASPITFSPELARATGGLKRTQPSP